MDMKTENNTQTLLIYENVPEETNVYVIPNRVFAEHPDWIELMRMAHGKFINQSNVEYNDGMSFLSAALTSAEHIDKDDYFFDGDAITREGNRMKKEWRCVLNQYKVSNDTPIRDLVSGGTVTYKVNITEVILSGFIM